MENKKKISSIGYTVSGILLFCFLYYILWLIFREKMPLHEYISDINANYDEYAGRIWYCIPLVIFILIFFAIFKPSGTKRFLRLQASLPTSRIASLAKGIVEVEGILIMKTPLRSPVSNEEMYWLSLYH
jgi:hypothetical protein